MSNTQKTKKMAQIEVEIAEAKKALSTARRRGDALKAFQPSYPEGK